MKTTIRNVFLASIGALMLVATLKAQSPTPMIIQAASPGAASAPASANAAAVAATAGSVTAALNALEEIKTANAETLKKQEDVLAKLDEMQKAADQLRIFAHRAGG
jgi:predicted cobalt transporter CbtA